MTFTSVLESHKQLSSRRESSLKKLSQVKGEFKKTTYFQELPICIFCAGSMARLEIGEKSDLDLFVVSDNRDDMKSRLLEYTLFSHIININKNLKFPDFSNDGEYLKIYFIDDLKNRTGSRIDDSENMFTARMLFILESKPLVDEERYNEYLTRIIDHYYRDERGKKSFRPLFLLNDLLRYWRTLCLNYEEKRGNTHKPWRKSNVNLKFSRMLTVFSMILPLVAKPIKSPEELKTYCDLPPLQRLAKGLDLLNDNNNELLEDWNEILNIYEEFLTWKDDDDIEKSLEDSTMKKEISDYADKFATYFYRACTHTSISPVYRRYLVL